VSRGRLTGPQSCEALSTFRGAEPDYVFAIERPEGSA
jgi:hypothetical protein